MEPPKKVGCAEQYELKNWIIVMGSFPVEEIRHEDMSESYTKRSFHVFKLENGRFATVLEEGCSCYSSEQAVIDVHADFRTADEKFEAWVKSNKQKDY
jgi:N-acetyl-gamma-glutamylphosphate reductase